MPDRLWQQVAARRRCAPAHNYPAEMAWRVRATRPQASMPGLLHRRCRYSFLALPPDYEYGLHRPAERCVPYENGQPLGGARDMSKTNSHFGHLLADVQWHPCLRLPT